LNFNDIIEKYNLRKVKISGQFIYYIKNKRNTLYFLSSKIYQNLIITAKTIIDAKTYDKIFLLFVYPVDNIKEIIKYFMESKNLPSSKYIITKTENINIKFIIEKEACYNINDMFNIDYVILEQVFKDGKYKYKLPFSDFYIEENY